MCACVRSHLEPEPRTPTGFLDQEGRGEGEKGERKGEEREGKAWKFFLSIWKILKSSMEDSVLNAFFKDVLGNFEFGVKSLED